LTIRKNESEVEDGASGPGGIGTFIYSSPEQLEDQSSTNEKSDIFSLGVILFEMLHPFQTKTERSFVLRDLRKGIIPEEMKMKFPKHVYHLCCILIF
jgi:serine/threonine protein kinase